MNLEAFKKWIRAHPGLESTAYLLHNNLFPFLNFSGTSLRDRSLDESATYVLSVAERYRSAAQFLGRSLEDTTVLEVGPGDNLAVALCLVAGGARGVVCIDRFNCLTELHRNRAIYRAVLGRISEEERRRAVEGCPWCLDPKTSLDKGAITYLPNVTLEQCASVLAAGGFDCALSNAALEHVKDVVAGIVAMGTVLAPDGWMFHEVDFRCHGRFAGISALHFLTIPEVRWQAMGANLGAPNRSRINTYRRVFRNLGFACHEDVREQCDRAVAEAVFPHVDPAVGAECVEDLMPLVVRFAMERKRS